MRLDALAWARAFSVLGHPALLMPVAVVVAALARGGGLAVVAPAAAAALTAAVAVGLYSLRQVRRGGWQHVDASVPRERRQLNHFLLPLLWGLALVLALSGQPRSVVLGMVAGGLIVVAAQALRRWMKLSLHVGFDVLAAGLLWPLGWAMAGLLILAAAVGWSRVVLGRHSWAEVAAGAAAGAGAAALWVLGAG